MAAEQQMLEQGPVDGSVLYLQHEHRSEAIQSDQVSVLAYNYIKCHVQNVNSCTTYVIFRIVKF